MAASEFQADVKGNVVTAEGELDMGTAPRLAALLDEAGRSEVILDLSKVSFMDARGLGVIVEAADRIAGEGSQLKIRGAKGVVRRVFELANVTNLLED